MKQEEDETECGSRPLQELATLLQMGLLGLTIRKISDGSLTRAGLLSSLNHSKARHLSSLL